MRLLVPIDGSTASHRAVEHAVWLARGRSDSSIVLANVQNRDTLGLSDIDAQAGSEADLASERSEKLLHGAVAMCQKAGIACETRAAFGPVADTIVRIAHETHADQIVMGSRGLGRLRGMLLGSVVTQVIHASEVPVTVVKRSTRLPGHSRPQA